MRIVDTCKRDTIRELRTIECDQVSGGAITSAPPPPEPQIPPTGGIPKAG
jgi:hypothetical protein